MFTQKDNIFFSIRSLFQSNNKLMKIFKGSSIPYELDYVSSGKFLEDLRTKFKVNIDDLEFQHYDSVLNLVDSINEKLNRKYQ